MNINSVVLTHGELVNRLIVSASTDEGFPKRMNAITFILIQNEHNFHWIWLKLMTLEGNNLPVAQKKKKKKSDNPITARGPNTAVTCYLHLDAFLSLLGMRLFEYILLGALNVSVTWLKWQGTDHHPEIIETKRNPQDQDQTKTIL